MYKWNVPRDLDMPVPPLAGTVHTIRVSVKAPTQEFFACMCKAGEHHVMRMLPVLGVAAEMAAKLSGIWYQREGKLYREKPRAEKITDPIQATLDMEECWGDLCGLQKGNNYTGLHAHTENHAIVDLQFADLSQFKA